MTTRTKKGKNTHPAKDKTTANKKAESRNRRSELLLPQEMKMLNDFVNAQHVKGDAVELLGLVNRGTLRTTQKCGSCSSDTLRKIRKALGITHEMIQQWTSDNETNVTNHD